jgi:hypothetical protein
VRKLIWLPLAGALLIGGAAVAAAAPDLVDDVTSSLASVPVRAGGLLADVLADLVAEGVITQEQSDAITGELETRGEQPARCASSSTMARSPRLRSRSCPTAT